MSYIKDMEKCQFLGCRNPQHEDATVTFEVPNAGEKTVRICLYHQSMISDTNASYSIGTTLRGEAEIRPISVAPPPAEPAPTD